MFTFCVFSYDLDDPYVRPEGHLGFVQDGHQVDPYGRALDPYGPEYGEYLNGGGDPLGADNPYYRDYGHR